VPTRTLREAVCRQIMSAVAFAFAHPALNSLLPASEKPRWRLLIALLLLSLAWLRFGIVVVSCTGFLKAVPNSLGPNTDGRTRLKEGNAGAL
jgi:hypothetical protein